MISINAKTLIAANEFAAYKDIRDYLNGVRIQARAHETIVTATDGHIACFIREQRDNDETLDFILPTETIKKMKPGYVVDITLSADRTISLTQGNVTTLYKAVDGHHPDCQRVFPRLADCTHVPMQFDPKLIARIGKAVQVHMESKYALMYIEHNGPTGCALALCDSPNFVGAIAGVRTDSAPVDNIEWIRS